MADVLHGATQLANWLNTEFSPAAFSFFQREMRLGNWALDYSALLAPGASAVKVPLSDLITVEARTNGESAVEYTGKASAESVGTISVNQYKTAAILINEIAKNQVKNNTDLMAHYIENVVYALRADFETYMAGTVLQGASTNDVNLTTDNTVSTAKLQEGIANLMSYNAYVAGQVALGMSPEAWAASVADWDDLYFHANAVGNPTMLTNGSLGTILGIPVYVTSDWDGTGASGAEAATLWNRNAVGYALQNAFGIIGPVPDPTRGGDGFSVELYYGAALLRETGVANFNQAA